MSFPGIPATISAVRNVAGDSQRGCPRADDVVLIACELATNAIRHSPSGLPGGEFTMRLWVRPGWLRLEVIDQGSGDWVVAPADSGGESGRGLVIVAALADIFGHCGNRAFAEVSWPIRY
ncbi:MAG TPA: ATP-binding protein [Streptosporangiaceae bacterium]|nr:ATP-binding protein [Streptosporangiaceae bacterium]